MLEPILYDIGRICKEKHESNSFSTTPKIIEFDINVPPLKTLKIPFDAPREVAEELVKLNKSEYVRKSELSYQIINAGKYADLIDIEENMDVYVISDLRQIIKRREMIEIIPKVREMISPNSGIYVPGAMPSEIPLLVYMGADYFDYSSASYYAAQGYKFSKNRLIKSEEDFESLKTFNESIIDQVLEEVKFCIESGSLRNLVEETTISNPYLRSNYRRFKPELTNIPISKSNKIIVTIDETKIPEVQKYIERAKNYEPYTNVIILLPCSSKKPYSYSKSHQFFINAINSVRMPVEELILTSPYGVVPRALERLVDYDIPVTGEWSADEIGFINKYLKNYIEIAKSKFEEVKIIAHLPEHYLEILDIDEDYIISSDGNPTSDNSLKNLKNILKELDQTADSKSKRAQRLHNYQELAKFQLGKNFLPEDVMIKGRHVKFFIKEGKNTVQLASINDNGLFVLTSQGGELLGKTNWVEVDFNVKKGSLFAPGFKDADEAVSVNDEVVIVKDNEVLGVGRALMSGKEMKKATHGVLVNIRHVK
ncbi:archaeosine synthase subunit alpha [Methanococcus maripaludis]|uniref:Archaeosine synthase n=1 Tax=Methanococcus maripaludis TaxID=39152 RepID=A0A2L1CB71_METMI|nr:archaeosine synthase subunit alpha [Methanococcus maripaludis]AVB76622.1 Queuine tRNA-ribosyltransferase [Methanococcus maripaludis]MBB6496864.1 archaeosine synthase [Methanococcus maripaludis]